MRVGVPPNDLFARTPSAFLLCSLVQEKVDRKAKVQQIPCFFPQALSFAYFVRLELTTMARVGICDSDNVDLDVVVYMVDAIQYTYFRFRD